MVKTTISLSIDSEIRDKAYEILRDKRIKFSAFVQQALLDLIEKEGYNYVEEKES